MTYEREIAGIFCGAGGLLALYMGETIIATALLTGILAFFVGEKNGQRTLKESSS